MLYFPQVRYALPPYWLGEKVLKASNLKKGEVSECVNHYKTFSKTGIKRSLEETASIGDCVYGVHNDCYGQGTPRIHGHYSTIVRSLGVDGLLMLLEEIRILLEREANKVRGDSLFVKTYNSFEEFYDNLRPLISKINGVGPLIAYDIIQRLSTHYSETYGKLKPLLPKDYVYLHAGVIEGANAIFGQTIQGNCICPNILQLKGTQILPIQKSLTQCKSSKTKKIYDARMLRSDIISKNQALSCLEAYEIEDFLCIYKKYL